MFELTSLLRNYVSEHKQKLIEDVLARRTRFLTVVLEDIYQSHNASAVIRSCDCFGVQDVHIIEGRNKYRVNPYVVQGAAKWINVNKYSGETSSSDCLAALKQKGYRLVGTTPATAGTIGLKDYQITKKTALIFGTEETGISKASLGMVDDLIQIPMRGFTESFNISVSAAICLYDLTNKLISSGAAWQLSDSEVDEIRLNWFRKIVRSSDALEREFLRTKENKLNN
jgi:tRNA (guanosine-2'-O-)-methyltransferase